MQRFWQRLTIARQTAPQPCVFCDHANLETNGILYEDDQVMAFRDKHPRATAHILVVPKNHIESTANLTPSHASIGTHHDTSIPSSHVTLLHVVEHMLNIGKDVLHQECLRLGHVPSKPAVFGFHQPPFNSINHLHLHCLAPPFLPSWNELRYIETPLLRNFITADSLLLQASAARPTSHCK
ncbi:hypothetical protein DYB26_015533 [Aphanomyces astaci]|uniref:HIT domain-containing protein n=1 Tax=Aphanomyces astaci TaxID=112090 RepID=A0A3R7DYE1_APHAT|nr:hypothetical protein DYB26_015533 [Aphanomyces astaci]